MTCHNIWFCCDCYQVHKGVLYSRLEIGLRQLQPHSFLMLQECMRMCLYGIHITSSVGLIA